MFHGETVFGRLSQGIVGLLLARKFMMREQCKLITDMQAYRTWWH